jgi:hypothetical protein
MEAMAGGPFEAVSVKGTNYSWTGPLCGGAIAGYSRAECPKTPTLLL